MHLVVNIGGIPHLAKNERDVGHPSLVREPKADPCGIDFKSGVLTQARASWETLAVLRDLIFVSPVLTQTLKARTYLSG